MRPIRIIHLLYSRRCHLTFFAIFFVCPVVLLLKIGIFNIVFSKTRLDYFIVETEDGLQGRMFSPAIGNYRLEHASQSDFSRGQSKVINELLGGKENGFFVDIGAGDGETNSVSLYFEREKHWSGVLVEANTTKHDISILKNRQCQLWNFRVQLDNKIYKDMPGDIKPDQLFRMVNHRNIDLLIININGFELELIKNIDFAKFSIKVITIELHHDVSNAKYEDISSTLSSYGYVAAHHIINSILDKKDVIFMKR